MILLSTALRATEKCVFRVKMGTVLPLNVPVNKTIPQSPQKIADRTILTALRVQWKVCVYNATMSILSRNKDDVPDVYRIIVFHAME